MPAGLSASSPPSALVTISRQLAAGSASCAAFSYNATSQSLARVLLRSQGVGSGSRNNSTRSLSRNQLVARPCAAKGSEEVDFVEDDPKSSVETGESDGKEAPKMNFSSKEVMEQLKRYGVAGVLSYGLLNTVYYLVTFLSVWFYFAPAPGKLGYAASVKRFLKIMGAVWAGSQVTKLFRAGGALALAPFVEKGLSWFTVKFKFNSKGKAFAAIAGVCFSLAFLLFILLTLLWA